MKTRRAWLSAILLAACGGNVAVDHAGPGGAGGTSGSTSTTSSATTSGATTSGITTTPNVCSSHADCTGFLCIFATGECVPPCGGNFCESCGAGSVCDLCATSSCPGCNDCVAACVPVTPGRCDDDDPCPPGQVCIYQDGYCAPKCSTDSDCGGFAFCAACITGSCCGCENCVSACIGGE